jgi:putative acyl-CoA dehydrogenase
VFERSTKRFGSLRASTEAAATMSTHEVFNQSTPLVDVDLHGSDRALAEAVSHEGGGWAEAELGVLGRELGSAAVLELGRLANLYPPVFKPYDRFGRRLDEVEFHPAWHELMKRLIGAGVHALPWSDPRPGAQVARAAKYFMFAQVENGTQCPTTMTYAVMPVMQKLAASVGAIREHWLPKLLSREYDPASAPVERKRSVLMGMGMTEKQGGSDVRTNTTRADYVGDSTYGAEYRLTGHKWFFSAPQCDAHLVLAQTDPDSPAGITCFFLPRYLPDGSRNAIRIQRLKDKVGNRSNASSEVEFDGARAWAVGEPGRGISTILEMGALTRFDCAIGSAGQMRAVVAGALHHASQRKAFNRRLSEHALMRNVLADLALESEAATALVLRLARAYDERGRDPLQEALCRVLTPAAKYWICKRGPTVGAEAMEVVGGNGYVEEAPLGRFYRELPLNSIWEGSGNVMCLDVLRALTKTPACREALREELSAAHGRDARYDAFVAGLLRDLQNAEIPEEEARRLSERIALAVQAALLIRHAPEYVSQGFCASRLAPDGAGWGRASGTLPRGVDLVRIMERASPDA